MRYAQIRSMDISDGPGIRVSLFTQGCSFHCKGCFNASTWDYNGGKEFTNIQIETILELSGQPHVVGLSILGGEPLSECNYEALLELLQKYRSTFPNKTIWMWTGHTFETLLKNKNVLLHNILQYLDVLVDGQFKEELHDWHLKYCGSSNQRVIDVKKSLAKNKTILFDTQM